MTTEEPRKIRMRGHHLFCITVMQNWTLWGPMFWENVEIYKQMMEDPNLIIEIVPHCCDTCAFCPQKIGEMCKLYDFIPGGNRIDLEILNQLGLSIGDEITVRDLKRRIKENFPQMPTICIWGCGVNDSGCAEGFEALKDMNL
jgi:hypothetical protein